MPFWQFSGILDEEPVNLLCRVDIDVNFQPAHNIPGVFAECSLSVSMFETTREDLGNIFKEKIF